MEDYQNENNRPDDKAKTIANVKRYLIPVLGVSLAAAVLSGIGYLYFSPAPKPDKVTVAVNDTAAVEIPETDAVPAPSFPADTLPPAGTADSPADASKPKITVAEEPSLVETKPIETARTDYSRLEVPETAKPATVTRPAPPVKAETTPALSKPRVTATPKPAPKPAAPAAPKAEKSGPRFYIQAGSFSTLANAEKAQQMLADKNINSIIETRRINDKTWYRVLIGAYASKDEAEQFKPTVRAIKGFENAMIRQYY